MFLGADGPMARRQHPDGVTLIHWRSGSKSGSEAYSGKLTREQVEAEVATWSHPGDYRGQYTFRE